MDQKLFERLMYEGEGATLDFKKEQYRFAKATDEEKSELIKDILGFANGWRRSDAYILIGVEDVKGDRAKVVGIPIADQLDDHSLQQFVNNLTSRPVRFHYEAFGYDGKQVGVIRIEQQPRPFYLKRDYGKLRKGEVYVRRGSSTDPTKPATPDEIAQMGAGVGPVDAEVVVEFAKLDRDDSLGPVTSWIAEYCEMPDRIPDLTPPEPAVPAGTDRVLASLMRSFTYPQWHTLNEDYWRQLAEYEYVRRLFRPVRLVIRNAGAVAADDVRVELVVNRANQATIIDEADVPERPKQQKDFLPYRIPNISQAFRPSGSLTINRNDERVKVEVECGGLQPGRKVWSDVFYIGKSQSGELTLSGFVYAANLPRPKEFSLTITGEIRQTQMAFAELRKLADTRR